MRSEHRGLGSPHVVPPASGVPWQIVHLQLLAGVQNPPSIQGFASPGPCSTCPVGMIACASSGRALQGQTSQEQKALW